MKLIPRQFAKTASLIRGVTVLLALFGLLWTCELSVSGEDDNLDAKSIENFHRINSDLTSGSEPRTEKHFQFLKSIGIKTIVSVDGSTPNVELAKKYEMRYVHIPIPYSGIPIEKTLMLTKVMKNCEQPVFVHCHHGLHRGPAAAAVCGVVQGHWDTQEAIEFMKLVGTDPAYVGLYRDVKNFSPPGKSDRAALEAVRLVESSPIDGLTEVMLRIEKHFDQLEKQFRIKTTVPAKVSAEAIAISEEFKEAARLQKSFPELRKQFEAAAQLARSLQQAKDDTGRKLLFAQMQASCVKCHATNRAD